LGSSDDKAAGKATEGVLKAISLPMSAVRGGSSRPEVAADIHAQTEIPAPAHTDFLVEAMVQLMTKHTPS
jgi:hypothetical protein